MESAVDRQLLTGESNHLRELLRLREHDNGNGNCPQVPGRTLGSVLNIDKKSSSPNQTLLNIIREDSSKDKKKTWNYFKDKLRLKRAGADWTSSLHIPASDVPMERNNSSNNNRMMMRRQSTRIPVSDPDPLPGLTDSSQSLSRRSSLLQRNASCIPHNSQEEENAVAEEKPYTEEEEGEEEAEGNGE